jgi:hypothetical protein
MSNRRELFISLVITLFIAGVFLSDGRSFLLVKIPNGTTVLWQRETSALKPDPANNRN